jgi:hypothetical protein
LIEPVHQNRQPPPGRNAAVIGRNRLKKSSFSRRCLRKGEHSTAPLGPGAPWRRLSRWLLELGDLAGILALASERGKPPVRTMVAGARYQRYLSGLKCRLWRPGSPELICERSDVPARLASTAFSNTSLLPGCGLGVVYLDGVDDGLQVGLAERDRAGGQMLPHQLAKSFDQGGIELDGDPGIGPCSARHTPVRASQGSCRDRRLHRRLRNAPSRDSIVKTTPRYHCFRR